MAFMKLASTAGYPKMFKTERSEVIKRFGKRGVTPLVATLLLISFSVGLGAVVMSWGQHYIEQTAEFITAAQAQPLGCDPVSISFITLGGRSEVCISSISRAVKAFIENGPKVAVDNIQARVVGSDDVDTVESILPSPLGRTASIKATFTHNPVGQVRQVKFTPYISVNNQKTYCDKGSVMVEDPIPECNG